MLQSENPPVLHWTELTEAQSKASAHVHTYKNTYIYIPVERKKAEKRVEGFYK